MLPRAAVAVVQQTDRSSTANPGYRTGSCGRGRALYVGVRRLTLHCCTSHLCSQEGCRAGCESRWGKLRGQLSTHAPSEQTHPQNSRSLQGVPPSCCGRRVAVWSGCSNRPSSGSGTTGKQPVSLAVEGAEESLSILHDYPPTVRPPTKRS
jgi:hypothetical protein